MLGQGLGLGQYDEIISAALRPLNPRDASNGFDTCDQVVKTIGAFSRYNLPGV